MTGLFISLSYGVINDQESALELYLL